PLASVQAYAELFERGARDRPEDLARAMAGIEREAQRMGVLVDDLLLLARLDQGRPLQRTEVDLTEVARDAVDVARVLEPERTRTEGGTGLGLAIVAAIAHAHEGSVGVDRGNGAGVAFRVSLPVF